MQHITIINIYGLNDLYLPNNLRFEYKKNESQATWKKLQSIFIAENDKMKTWKINLK